MELPKRKHIRLKDYDYSSDGAYFVTICTEKRRLLLSSVSENAVVLSPAGQIAEQQLLALPQRYPHLQICKYVIMPNHIHIILQWESEAAGASPRPTLSDIICAYKSLTAHAAKKVLAEKLFQTSFYEQVLRSEEQFLAAW
ncbi:MAG: transposase, partial [Firmicutes bacterium]|nr:transposase [Bacillota bacterium]